MASAPDLTKYLLAANEGDKRKKIKKLGGVSTSDWLNR